MEQEGSAVLLTKNHTLIQPLAHSQTAEDPGSTWICWILVPAGMSQQRRCVGVTAQLHLLLLVRFQPLLKHLLITNVHFGAREQSEFRNETLDVCKCPTGLTRLETSDRTQRGSGLLKGSWQGGG